MSRSSLAPPPHKHLLSVKYLGLKYRIKSLLLWFRQQILTLKVNVQLKTLGHNILFSQKVQQITTHLVVNSSNIPVSALLHVCLDSSSKTQGQTAGDSHTDLEMK